MEKSNGKVRMPELEMIARTGGLDLLRTALQKKLAALTELDGDLARSQMLLEQMEGDMVSEGEKRLAQIVSNLPHEDDRHTEEATVRFVRSMSKPGPEPPTAA
jgi:hypothetical protein